MFLLVHLPVLRSLDGLVAWAALTAVTVVQLMDFSLVIDTIVIKVVAVFATRKTAVEPLTSVFCYVVFLHGLLGAICIGAVWVGTLNAIAVAHVR